MQHKLFGIVGEDFFKPLTSQYKSIYLDCLSIIFDAYRSELSYGADRSVLIARLTDYFESSAPEDIMFEDDPEVLHDARGKASRFLRKLKEFGWIEVEFFNDNTQRVIMPNHAVTMIQTLTEIARRREMEYQSEISVIYSLLTNRELLNRPWAQVLKPVYDRTLALFTELKKLNTGIRRYIDELTADKDAEEIIHDFFTYHDQIGSQAYHRIKTSDNISRFRNTIRRKLKALRRDTKLLDLTVDGFMAIENEDDRAEATEQVHYIINDVLDHFAAYDDIVEEIDRKHSKYIRNAVERAKFLLLNSNDMEGKLSTILQAMAAGFEQEERSSMVEDIPEGLCSIFNIFPQGFLSSESLKAIPVSRKITSIDELHRPLELTDEERELRRQITLERNRRRFSRKNIERYVMQLLEGRDDIMASEVPMTTRRDMIRMIFVDIYGHRLKSGYVVIPTNDYVETNGYRFKDFKIARRLR